MKIKTVFGIYWVQASYPQVAIVLAFILFIITVFLLFRYYQNKKNKEIHDHSLFLFKMKRIGLSSFQIKIINNMVRVLKLSNPNELFKRAELFEWAIGNFLLFLKSQSERGESLADICKDITITYEKIYSPSEYRKPLERISDIEISQLLYLTLEDSTIYIGKIISINEKSLALALFRDIKELQGLAMEKNITVYIWRIGDAEYVFQSKTLHLDRNILTISMPEEFSREKEFRHPYIDAILPATIVKTDPDPVEEAGEIPGTLLKINEYEAVIRTEGTLDYKFRYTLNFTLMEFNFTIITSILANKTIEERNAFYHTLKLQEMSDAAREVLKRYMYDHL